MYLRIFTISLQNCTVIEFNLFSVFLIDCLLSLVCSKVPNVYLMRRQINRTVLSKITLRLCFGVQGLDSRESHFKIERHFQYMVEYLILSFHKLVEYISFFFSRIISSCSTTQYESKSTMIDKEQLFFLIQLSSDHPSFAVHKRQHFVKKYV